MRRWFALALLLLAAAAPVDSAAPTRPRTKPMTKQATTAKPPEAGAKPAKPAEIAEQLGMLMFDANPAWAIQLRAELGRWAGPMRLFVIGAPAEKQEARTIVPQLARATGLAIDVTGPGDPTSERPNAFMVVDDNLPAAMRGPLRPMLTNVFLDDPIAVERFLADVVDQQTCWALPVWRDATRLVMQAAVIAVDAKLPLAERQHCMLRGAGAALGLLGPGAFLPASAFVPGAGPVKLSGDDERMLRVLFGKTLTPGMTREAAEAAARKALEAPAAKPAPKKKPPAPPKPGVNASP